VLLNKNSWAKMGRIIAGLLLLVIAVRTGALDPTQALSPLWSWREFAGLILLGWCPLWAGNLLGIYRWRVLGKIYGAPLSASLSIRVNIVGESLNLLLPGGVAGDGYKVWTLRKHCESLTPLGIMHWQLLDRSLGAVSLFGIGLVVWAIGDSPKHLSLEAQLGIPLGLAIGVIAFVLLPLISLSQSGRSRLRDPQMFRLLGRAVVASLASLGLVILGLVGIAQRLQVESVATSNWIASLPLALAVASIPLLPLSIGSGHLAFAAILSWAGFQLGAALFNLYLAHWIPILVLGLIFLMKSDFSRKDFFRSQS
jgi:hypothetical protein